MVYGMVAAPGQDVSCTNSTDRGVDMLLTLRKPSLLGSAIFFFVKVIVRAFDRLPKKIIISVVSHQLRKILFSPL